MPGPAPAHVDRLSRFDRFLIGRPERNPWSPEGAFAPDLDLLRALVVEAVGTSQRSGVVAGAVDVWAAEELRGAGIPADDVWPRRTPPRVLPRDVRRLLEGAFSAGMRASVEERFAQPGARRALPAEAHVVGRAFRKQSDVLVASWEAGIELLISTKTMLSSYQKNLRNRFEEGYGDAKNLRGRHPLAALGFLFVVGADIPAASLEFAVDMLRKLTSESDVYDRACLLVLDGLGGRVEETGDEPPEPPPAEPDDDQPWLFDPGPAAEPAGPEVAIVDGAVPADLCPAAFFRGLVEAALERMPFEAYPEVRARRREVGLG
jgi:hypothetical protein